jgi:hypothetical protein
LPKILNILAASVTHQHRTRLKTNMGTNNSTSSTLTIAITTKKYLILTMCIMIKGCNVVNSLFKKFEVLTQDLECLGKTTIFMTNFSRRLVLIFFSDKKIKKKANTFF